MTYNQNKHEASDLSQMQSLSLTSKERMTGDRADAWYEAWVKYEIFNKRTKTTRFCTMDTDPEESFFYTVVIEENEEIKKKVIITDKEHIKAFGLEVVKQVPFLKDEEFVVSGEPGQVYISYSGGKDSTVLKRIVKERHPDVPVVFVNTGLEHNSVREMGTKNSDVILTPEKNFIQIITEYGYPVISKEVAHKIHDYRSAVANGKDSYVRRQFEGTYVTKNGKTNMIDITKYKYLLDAPFRISHLCCDYSKKLPTKNYEKETGRKPFIGTLAEESMLRYSKWIKHGCNAFNTDRPTSQPLSFWTEQDILSYLKLHEVPIASAYGDILYSDADGFLYESPFVTEGLRLKTTKADRTGCVFCMFGIAYDTERFLRLRQDDPVKYDFVMRGGKYDEEGYWVPDNGLGFKFVIDWLNEHGGLDIKY